MDHMNQPRNEPPPFGTRTSLKCCFIIDAPKLWGTHSVVPCLSQVKSYLCILEVMHLMELGHLVMGVQQLDQMTFHLQATPVSLIVSRVEPLEPFMLPMFILLLEALVAAMHHTILNSI
jgi:hypothetical protein